MSIKRFYVVLEELKYVINYNSYIFNHLFLGPSSKCPENFIKICSALFELFWAQTGTFSTPQTELCWQSLLCLCATTDIPVLTDLHNNKIYAYS